MGYIDKHVGRTPTHIKSNKKNRKPGIRFGCRRIRVTTLEAVGPGRVEQINEAD